MWALVATFVEATMDILAQFGMAGTSTDWPVYGLAVGGVAEGPGRSLSRQCPSLASIKDFMRGDEDSIQPRDS